MLGRLPLCDFGWTQLLSQHIKILERLARDYGITSAVAGASSLTTPHQEHNPQLSPFGQSIHFVEIFSMHCNTRIWDLMWMCLGLLWLHLVWLLASY